MKKICAAALILVLLLACAVSVLAEGEIKAGEGFSVNSHVLTQKETDDTIGDFAEGLESKGKSIEKAFRFQVSNSDGHTMNVQSLEYVELTLGESDKNNEYEVWYLAGDDSLRVVKTKYVSRSGDVLKIKIDAGTFVSDTETLVLVKIGEKSTSVAIPITVGILTVIVAVGVVFFVISKNKKESF